VAARIARGRGVDEAIAWLASRIHASGGTASVTALRQATGLPATRLRSAFHEQIGVTPKVYARLVRFGRALAMLQRGDRRLADVALDAGFYDQPHMNAEFRDLGGLSPREFLAARHPNGDGTTAMDLRPDEA
jgi:AraC-like DNA-binding protein